jgi:hypothetical protein
MLAKDQARSQEHAVCFHPVRGKPSARPCALPPLTEKNDDAAEKAIREGRGAMIDGRMCRTERAKVKRKFGSSSSGGIEWQIFAGSLYLSRIAGGKIDEDEARWILSGRGDLEKIWHAGPTEMKMFVWVSRIFAVLASQLGLVTTGFQAVWPLVGSTVAHHTG